MIRSMPCRLKNHGHCPVDCRCLEWGKRQMSDLKPSNPKDAVGIRKAGLSASPTYVQYLVGLAMAEGARKYGRHNYREVGVRYSVYYDAALRHLHQWWEGEDVDPDSGLPHPAKAVACLAVLLDAMLLGNGSDDRPPKYPEGWMKPLHEAAGKIIDAYPDAKPAHVEKVSGDAKETMLEAYARLTDPLTGRFKSERQAPVAKIEIDGTEVRAPCMACHLVDEQNLLRCENCPRSREGA